MLGTVLLWLLAATVAIQCFFAFRFFIKVLSFPTPVPSAGELRPVSVIICARNEAPNLLQNLPEIMAQRYTSPAGKPLFEVIVVNDCSEDNTEAVLQQLEQQYENLWHVTILPEDERCYPGKKFALSRALEHAAHSHLLLIDADCAPAGQHWMEYMVAPLNEGKEIVAGYGKYSPAPGLVNDFTRWETLHTFLQYSTYTLANKPYMAVGRNLACTKGILLKAQSTEVWGELPSGDDDLLVSTMATATNMAIVCHPGAFTTTESKTTWSAWLRQKQRHMSTGKYYKPDIKILLGSYALSHALFWLLFFCLIFTPLYLNALVLFAVRCLLYWFIWAAAAKRLGEIPLIPLFPVFDIAWMIYNFVLSPYIVLKNKRQWT